MKGRMGPGPSGTIAGEEDLPAAVRDELRYARPTSPRLTMRRAMGARAESESLARRARARRARRKAVRAARKVGR